MDKRVYTIYDSKAEVYMPPFMFGTKGEAIRAVTTTVNDGQSALSQFPEDYTLFEIGTWSDEDAVYRMHEAKESLGCVVEYKKEPVEQMSMLKEAR